MDCGPEGTARVREEFTRQRDALTRRRMPMPWEERVEKSYQFVGNNLGIENGWVSIQCIRGKVTEISD
jgi:hypothetical protein